MSDATYNIDATALFYARPAPDHQDLLDELNALFAEDDGCDLTLSPLSHEDWWLLSCTQFHIMVGFAAQMAPEAKLARAKNSPINALSRFEYAHVAQNHQAHVTIEIGDGNAPLPPEARQIMREFGEVTTCAPKLKMRALHHVAQFIARHSGFLALHFGPSDRMISPEDLQAARGQDMPLMLLLHPVPTEVALDAHGKESYALRLHSPDHLPGPVIELDGIPKAVPLGTSVSLLTTLIKAKMAGKVALAEGDVLSPSKKWSLYVHVGEVAGRFGAQDKIVLSFYPDRPAGLDAARVGGAAATSEQDDAPKGPLAARAKAVIAQMTKSHAPAKDAQPTKHAAGATARRATTPTAKGPARAPSPAPRIEALTNIVSRPKAAPRPDASLAPSAPTSEAPALQPLSGQSQAKITPKQAASPEPAAQGQPAERVGLVSWMVSQSRALQPETRVRAGSIALIAATLTLADPYAGFTGGHMVDAARQTAAAQPSQPEAGRIDLLAALDAAEAQGRYLDAGTADETALD